MQKPAYAGFAGFGLRKPAEAGFRRLLLSVGRHGKGAGVSRRKPASSGQKKPALARKASSFCRRSRLWPEAGFLWAPRKEPAKAGSRRLLSGQRKPALSARKAGFFLARTEAGFGRLRRLPFRGAQRYEYVTAGTALCAVSSFLHDVIFEAPRGAERGLCGKHSYRAQRKEPSRQKPAFPVFSWVRKAGFCRLCRNRLLLAKRGPYSGSEEPNPTEAARRAAEGVFLTSF